jgi:hypothetical protein
MKRKIFVLYENCKDNNEVVELVQNALNSSNSCFTLKKVTYSRDENELPISALKAHIIHGLSDYNKRYDAIFVIKNQMTQNIFRRIKMQFTGVEISIEDLSSKINQYIKTA